MLAGFLSPTGGQSANSSAGSGDIESALNSALNQNNSVTLNAKPKDNTLLIFGAVAGVLVLVMILKK